MNNNINLVEQHSQNTRKMNLKKIVDELFLGSVENFSKDLGKNKFFVYGLLWNSDKKSTRKITDKTARLIERHFNLPDGYLDEEEPMIDLSVAAIPFIDIHMSENNDELVFADIPKFTISNLELKNNKIESKNLVAIRMNDESMNDYFKTNDVVLVDRSKVEFIKNQIYLLKIGKSLILRYVYRNIVTDNIELIALSNSFSNSFITIELDSISKIEILGTFIFSINYFKGL
jgi:hypothetical protein